jgi:hypothetical protein
VRGTLHESGAWSPPHPDPLPASGVRGRTVIAVTARIQFEVNAATLAC